MLRNQQFAKRIGAVSLPLADAVIGTTEAGFTPDPFGPVGPTGPVGPITSPVKPVEFPQPWPFKICSFTLKEGCYTLSFLPAGAHPIFGPRFRGTMRVEQVGNGYRISGDLYRRPFLFPHFPIELLLTAPLSGDAEDTGGVIPIFRRQDYRSYLKGTAAQLFSIVPKGVECSFTLDFDEFLYIHPGTGFSGSFPAAPTRTLRFVLKGTGTPDFYQGDAFEGATNVGTVSVRWVSPFYRRADLVVHTLEGATTPPASVDGNTFQTIFADVGWDLSVTDGGTVPLPASLPGVDIHACWSLADLHTLMESVPGYNPTGLDSAWRSHLVAVPAQLGCARGVMFDSSLGADPNAIPREGTATFSDDGYPAGEVPDGMGGSHYDAAADHQQKDTPRAFLRSATHEVGHAFNQIHQGFEGGNDNSIMTPTPSVATVLGIGGTFPNQINLAFNDTVK
jgi:hypothetical protein